MQHTIFLLAFLALAIPALAEVVVTESVEYYDLHGTSQSVISRNLREHTPLSVGGRDALATTEYRVTYDYDPVQSGDRCTPDNFTVHVDITYTYPHLVDEDKLSSRTRNWWRDKLAFLEEHEEMHGAISTKYAEKFDREIARKGDMQCATIEEYLKQRQRYWMNKMDIKHTEFDRMTRRGTHKNFTLR